MKVRNDISCQLCQLLYSQSEPQHFLPKLLFFKNEVKLGKKISFFKMTRCDKIRVINKLFVTQRCLGQHLTYSCGLKDTVVSDDCDQERKWSDFLRQLWRLSILKQNLFFERKVENRLFLFFKKIEDFIFYRQWK